MRMLAALLFGLLMIGATAPTAAAKSYDADRVTVSSVDAQKCSILPDAAPCALDVQKLTIAFATGARGADVSADVGDCAIARRKPNVTQMALQFATGGRGIPTLPTTTLWASRRGDAQRAEAHSRRFLFV